MIMAYITDMISYPASVERCIVLYCIIRPYTERRLDRYRIGILRELSEIRADAVPSPISLSARILHRAPPPPPAPSGPKFYNSENCCGSENGMPPKIFWDMEGHRGHFR